MGENIQVSESGLGQMVGFPPLAPDAEWFSRFMEARGKSGDTDKAIREANRGLKSPKVFGRFVLKDADGNLRTQSVAVEGGSRQLRSYSNIEGLNLSDHGNWPHVHLGAIEALIGRAPFYKELEEQIKGIYLDKELKTMHDFNFAIFHVLFSFLMGNIGPEFSGLPEEGAVLARGEEIAAKIDPEVSLLQTLAMYGPETLLGICSGFPSMQDNYYPEGKIL